MSWKVETYKIGKVNFWRVSYNDKITFIINRCQNRYFNIMLYETDTKISKIYNCNVIKSNEIILDFVNKHDICDETLMYILFNIF